MTEVVKKEVVKVSLADLELSHEAKQLLCYLKGIIVGFYPVEEPFKSQGLLVFCIDILGDCFDRTDDIPFEEIRKPLTDLSEIYQISFEPTKTISVSYTVTKNKNTKGVEMYHFSLTKKGG